MPEPLRHQALVYQTIVRTIAAAVADRAAGRAGIDAQCTAGERMKCRGLINIDQLHVHRHSRDAPNHVPQLRPALYRGCHATVTLPNRFRDPMHDHAERRKLYREVMDRVTAEGLYPLPASGHEFHQKDA